MLTVFIFNSIFSKFGFIFSGHTLFVIGGMRDVSSSMDQPNYVTRRIELDHTHNLRGTVVIKLDVATASVRLQVDALFIDTSATTVQRKLDSIATTHKRFIIEEKRILYSLYV